MNDSLMRQSTRASLRAISDSLLLGGRAQSFVIAALAVATVALMVLPLPTVLLDLLISINIGLSVLLLMLALYVPSLLSLSTFPTLLLLTTLLRLSLNIATTRAILLNADAGQVVETFGRLVVGGNVVVGVVVFLIIAIVQFIVIAKGAERVAEVGARFTLDALPGKQMSIDAELRAGLIDKDESQLKRELLQKESQLYGAMDGAMKFVKGDAIAGLLIALVNLLAGIAIGVTMKDMSFAQAGSTYSLLTVGDGLASQIPSLFVSLAAGILITRVSDRDARGSALASDVGAQLVAQPKALLLTGFVLLLFMLIPGFPRLQFLTWSAVFLGSGYWFWRQGRKRKAFEPMMGESLHRDGLARPRRSEDLDRSLVDSYALELRISPSSKPLVEAGQIEEQVSHARRTVTQRMGLAFPGVSIVVDAGLKPNTYSLRVAGVPVSEGLLGQDALHAQCRADQLEALGIETGSTLASSETNGVWVPATLQPAFTAKALELEDHASYLGRVIQIALVRNAGDFLGLQETMFLLAEAEKTFPDLVAEVQKSVPPIRLAEVLRRLVQEDIPVRNMREILQAVLMWAPKEKDVVLLTEHARNALNRQITYQYGGVSKKIHCIIFDQAAEEAIRAAVKVTPGGNFLALDPRLSMAVADLISDLAVDGKAKAQAMLVVMVSMDIRRYVKSMIEAKLPDLAVMSYQDLSPDAQLSPVGSLEWGKVEGSTISAL
jgi:type III secretion protein V